MPIAKFTTEPFTCPSSVSTIEKAVGRPGHTEPPNAKGAACGFDRRTVPENRQFRLYILPKAPSKSCSSLSGVG